MIIILCICYKQHLRGGETRHNSQLIRAHLVCRYFSTRTHYTFGTANFSRQSEKKRKFSTKFTNYSLSKKTGNNHLLSHFIAKSSVNLLTGRLNMQQVSTHYQHTLCIESMLVQFYTITCSVSHTRKQHRVNAVLVPA